MTHIASLSGLVSIRFSVGVYWGTLVGLKVGFSRTKG